jgi:hypothetical protein
MYAFEGTGFLFASHFAGRILGTGCRICLIVLRVFYRSLWFDTRIWGFKWIIGSSWFL